MELQTLLLWAARLACPLAMGLMIWWMMRQSNPTPEQTPPQQLSALHKRRVALDVEIKALEAQASKKESADKLASPE